MLARQCAPMAAARAGRSLSTISSMLATAVAHASGSELCEWPHEKPSRVARSAISSLVHRGAHREPAAEMLRQRHDVGFHPDGLVREHRAELAEPGLRLVVDEERAAP